MAFINRTVRMAIEANSLYITTVPLPVPGRFHWSFVHVDEDGRCTKHHWVTATIDSSGPEAYVPHSLPYGALNHTHNLSILAYFKISDYTPTNLDEFKSICAEVFPQSYPSAAQNRVNRISCRTWITHILTRLLSAERANQTEAMVTERSTPCSDEYATSFLHRRPYITIMVDI